MNNKLLFLLILILLFVVYNFIKKKEYFFPGMSSDEDFFAPETPEEENTIESTIQNLITGTNIIDVITPDEDSSIHQSGLDSQQVSNPNTSQTDFLTQTMTSITEHTLQHLSCLPEQKRDHTVLIDQATAKMNQLIQTITLI